MLPWCQHAIVAVRMAERVAHTHNTRHLGRRWQRRQVQRLAWAPQRWALQLARLSQPVQALPWRLALAQQ